MAEVIAFQSRALAAQLGNQPILSGSVVALLDFTAANSYTVSLQLLTAQQQFGVPKSVYIDNADNPNAVVIDVSGSNDRVRVPAYSVGMLPLMAQSDSQLTITSNGGAAGKTFFELFNYERPPYVYSGLTPFVPGFQVEALPMNAVSMINRNTSLVMGVAQNVFPVVSATRQCYFKNLGGFEVYWQINVTATGVFANGDNSIDPGESITLPYRTAQRISFICPGGAANIEAKEWAS